VFFTLSAHYHSINDSAFQARKLTLQVFWLSLWCSTDLHCFQILCSITGCWLPSILRPCSGLTLEMRQLHNLKQKGTNSQ